MQPPTTARLRASALATTLLLSAALLSSCGSKAAGGDTTIFTDLKRNPTTTVADSVVDTEPTDAQVVDSSPSDSSVDTAATSDAATSDAATPDTVVSQDATAPADTFVTESTSTTSSAASSPASAAAGPVANTDHWHAAYGIYDCDHYTAAIDGTQMEDPDGIHTHDDGLIHIHPFTDAASGKNAVLARFMKVVGIQLTATSLKVPSLGISVGDGDDCNGRPGKVRVVMFSGADHLTVTEVKDPAKLHLEQGQVLAFVFAPVGAKLLPPPSLVTLDTPPDVAITFDLTPERKALIGDPPVLVKPVGAPPTKLVVTDIEVGKGPAASATAKVGVMYTLMAWSTGQEIDSNWTSGEIFGFPMGAGRTIPGFEQGITGMKVGGLRKIVVPPSLGYGADPPTDLIKPNETLVFWVRLLAIEERTGSVGATTVPRTTQAPVSA